MSKYLLVRELQWKPFSSLCSHTCFSKCRQEPLCCLFAKLNKSNKNGMERSKHITFLLATRPLLCNDLVSTPILFKKACWETRKNVRSNACMNHRIKAFQVVSEMTLSECGVGKKISSVCDSGFCL